MGNYTIVIEGTGAHHNGEAGTDADTLLKEFVQALKSKGHQLDHVSITYSGRDLVQ